MNARETPLDPTSAILLAAGASTRMGTVGDQPRKPFLVLEGRTLLEHACAAFDRSPAVREIVLVGHPEDRERLERMVAACPPLAKVRRIVDGGELRTDSVRAGLAAIDPESRVVAVHDVARALIESSTIDAAILCARRRGAALVAVPVVDTIKTSSDGAHAESTLDRSVLWAAQTPQVFRVDVLRKVLDAARAENYRPTDDAALHGRYLGPVPIVHGSPQNLKITTPEDLVIAAAILRSRATTRHP